MRLAELVHTQAVAHFPQLVRTVVVRLSRNRAVRTQEEDVHTMFKKVFERVRVPVSVITINIDTPRELASLSRSLCRADFGTP